nr:hypothetical protein [Bacteroidota bacterium]
MPILFANVDQHLFSQDGKKFGMHIYTYGSTIQNYAIVCDFDRCTGIFSNPNQVLLDKGYLWGDAFSASGKYFYTCSSGFIFQINTSTFTVDTVAVYDGFLSAGLPASFMNYTLPPMAKYT